MNGVVCILLLRAEVLHETSQSFRLKNNFSSNDLFWVQLCKFENHIPASNHVHIFKHHYTLQTIFILSVFQVSLFCLILSILLERKILPLQVTFFKQT
jgi:hypothetical protein